MNEMLQRGCAYRDWTICSARLEAKAKTEESLRRRPRTWLLTEPAEASPVSVSAAGLLKL